MPSLSPKPLKKSINVENGVKTKDMPRFKIRLEFESAVGFDSIPKGLADSKISESNRTCLPLARRKLSQTTQTINGT